MPREVRIVTGRWHMDGVADPPDDSVVGTPDRRAGSIRRTAHVNATWPDGYRAAMHLRGRGRDIVTPTSGDPVVRGLDEMHVELDASHTIVAVTVRPHRDGVERLVGTSGLKGFRASVNAMLPRERANATPLSFLLDDVPALSVIAGIAWAQHRPLDIPTEQLSSGDELTFQRTDNGRIACSGLRPGGYHQQSFERGITFPHFIRAAGDLTTSDEWAWHEIDPAPPVCFRRRRRIDAWRSDDAIEVDAHFRDSVWGPDHDEIALHEYTLTASISRESYLVRSIDVASRVLPFPECPSAAPHVQKLVGSDVASIRSGVQHVLTDIHACTHLNDMLRGLSDVPAMVTALDDD